MMNIFRKYFLLFMACILLASCGGGGDSSSSSGSQGILAPLQAGKASAATVALTTEQQLNIIRLMQAMFNAAPGTVNLNYLGSYLSNGADMTTLANLLAQTDIFKGPALYPPSLSSEQFASRFIDNLVGDTANALDKSTLASAIVYYLDNGLSRGEAIWLVASLMTKIPVTDPHWGRASAQFANKVGVAYYYSVTTTQSSNDLGTLQAVTKYVTDDPATVIAAKTTKPVNLAPSWAFAGVTSSSRQITLNWAKTTKASSTASTYTIYWSKNPGVTKKTGNKIANATAPYIHTGLTNDTTYYYVVTETVAGVEGPESLEVATTPKAVLPLAPSGITVAPLNAATQITIDRTGAAATTKFNLYWSKTAGLQSPTKIANAFGTGTTFQHTALTNGTTYYYAVSAEGPEGESALSKTVAATPLADKNAINYQAGVSPEKLAAPIAITATASNQSVTLGWDMPVNQIPTVFSLDTTPTQPPVISGYTIYWSTASITDTTKANKISVPVTAKTKPPLTFTHNTGLANNTPYYYVITAVAATDANGNALKTADGRLLTFESPISSQVMATPTAKVPVPPAGLTAMSGAQQISLTWPASVTSGAVYHLYVSDKMPAKPEDMVKPANLVGITSTAAYTHSGLQYGITYYYVVTAVVEGESPPTAVVAITLL